MATELSAISTRHETSFPDSSAALGTASAIARLMTLTTCTAFARVGMRRARKPGMRSVLFALVVIAACQHDARQSPQSPDPVPTTASNDDIDHMPTDPTLPSWAPRECVAYHAAVIRLAECDAVSQESRNVVKTQYDTDNARWKALHDQPPEQIEYVRDDCRAASESVEHKNACLAQNQFSSAAR